MIYGKHLFLEIREDGRILRIDTFGSIVKIIYLDELTGDILIQDRQVLRNNNV